MDKIDLVRSLDSLHRDGHVSLGLDRRWRISGARASASGNVDTPPTLEAGALAAVPARFSLTPITYERLDWMYRMQRRPESELRRHRTSTAGEAPHEHRSTKAGV